MNRRIVNPSRSRNRFDSPVASVIESNKIIQFQSTILRTALVLALKPPIVIMIDKSVMSDTDADHSEVTTALRRVPPDSGSRLHAL